MRANREYFHTNTATSDTRSSTSSPTFEPDSPLDRSSCDCAKSSDMSVLSPTRTYFSEKVRYAAGMGQSGKFRINVQIGLNQFHISILLPETRTFNYIMDELQTMFNLSEFQRQHTRIFLQTLLGETEVLVDARPNYQTQRNIDYVAVPANPVRPSRLQQKSRLICYLLLAALVLLIGLSIVITIDFAVLRPRLIASTRRQAIGTEVVKGQTSGSGLTLPPATGMQTTPPFVQNGVVPTVTVSPPPLPLPNAIATTGLLVAKTRRR